MRLYKNEQGIGIVEVMVALMLLAIAVLGFSAMQLASVQSTDESLMRTRALAIMRGGAENMRGYVDGIEAFKDVLGPNANVANSKTVEGKSITKNSCLKGETCSVKQLATKDAFVLRDFATTQGIRLAMDTCPGTSGRQTRQCLIAAWGSTQANFGSGEQSCASNTTGVQNPGASCFVMEAY